MLCRTKMLANLLIMKPFTKPGLQPVKLFCILLIILPFISHAAVYKHVDKEGRLIKYSDQPQKPGDEPLKMPKPALEYKSNKGAEQSTPQRSESRPKRKEQKKESKEKKAVIAYTAVTILKPDDEEAIRANSGSFPIELASQPKLDTKSGHRYVIFVDGKKQTESTSARFTVNNMDRGAHSISAEVHDKDGNVLVSSSSKTIYVLRASRR